MGKRQAVMAVAGMALAAAAVALARSPGDFWPGGGTEPAVWSPYLRTLAVYGTVRTNDVAVFMDNTGGKIRGTNMADAVAGMGLWPTFGQATGIVDAAVTDGTNGLARSERLTLNFLDFGGSPSPSGGDAAANDAAWIAVTNRIRELKSTASPYGASVFFPRGYYLFDSPVYVPRDTFITGDGNFSTIIGPSASLTNAWFLSTASSVRDIAVEGRGGACIMMRPTFFSRFQNVVTSGGAYGIMSTNTPTAGGWAALYNCSFTSLHILNPSAGAIRLGLAATGDHNLVFDDVYVLRSTRMTDIPINLGNSFGLKFGSTVIKAVGTISNNLIQITASDYASIGPIWIEDVYFASNETAIITFCQNANFSLVRPKLDVWGVSAYNMSAVSGAPQTNAIVRGSGDINVHQMWYATNLGSTNWTGGCKIALAMPTQTNATIRLGSVTVGGGVASSWVEHGYSDGEQKGTVWREQRGPTVIGDVTDLQSALDGKVAASSGTATKLTLIGAVTLTNSTSFAAGVYGAGTNGVYFTRDGTNFWILLQ